MYTGPLQERVIRLPAKSTARPSVKDERGYSSCHELLRNGRYERVHLIRLEGVIVPRYGIHRSHEPVLARHNQKRLADTPTLAVYVSNALAHVPAGGRKQAAFATLPLAADSAEVFSLHGCSDIRLLLSPALPRWIKVVTDSTGDAKQVTT